MSASPFDHERDRALGAALRHTLSADDDEAFAKAIREWNFTSPNGLAWHGEVAGPDKFRFLGTLSRYAGVLASLNIEASTGENLEAAE